MINNELNSLIMEAMKAGDKVRTNGLRAIKTAMMQWSTAKENVGKVLDETVEINIIRKLKDQYNDAANQCNDGKHEDLVIENLELAKIMEEFLPAPITESEIENAFNNVVQTGLEPIKKNMGVFIKEIKKLYPTADGKLISQVVGRSLN